MDRKEQIKAANPYGNSSDFSAGKKIGFVIGAEWADAHPMNPWISVKDKLPEENSKVFFILLFRGIHKEYLAGLYREHKWETERRTYLSPSFDGIVTHWMPIPELNAEPKE